MCKHARVALFLLFLLPLPSSSDENRFTPVAVDSIYRKEKRNYIAVVDSSNTHPALRVLCVTSLPACLYNFLKEEESSDERPIRSVCTSQMKGRSIALMCYVFLNTIVDMRGGGGGSGDQGPLHPSITGRSLGHTYKLVVYSSTPSFIYRVIIFCVCVK